MKKRFIGSTTGNYSTSPSESLSTDIMNFSDSNSDIINKSIKNIFNTSKLYYTYLSTVQMKITNSNETDANNVKNFNEFYDNAKIIYSEIEKEWFWISNSDIIKQFVLKSDSMESHKQNYYNNFQMLEAIAKMYGFDCWYTNQKKNKSSKQTNFNDSEIEDKLNTNSN